MNADLKLCIDALAAKQIPHSRRWRYYDGDHPIAFTNPKLSDVIKNGCVFKKNWCEVIINATRDRLRIQDWNTKDNAQDELVEDIWRKSLRKCASRVHLAALTTGEAYLIAWPDAQGKPRAYYHDPRQAHVVYEEDDPDTPRVACKTWLGKTADGRDVGYLNLYYKDRIEHYWASNVGMGVDNYVPTTDPAPVETHPYGVIPVFHFLLDKRRCVGELTTGILSLQDALNKLLNDMMVSSEFSAFAQRWAIGNFDPSSKIPTGPGLMTKFPAAAAGDQPTAVGTFETTPPENYLTPMDNMSNAMAILSRTPKHFFFAQSGDPSGEALAAMEAPLVAKVQEYQETLADTWVQVAAFMLALDRKDIDAEDIEVIWQPAHTVQPMSQAQIRMTNVQAGIPITNILRDEGWTDDDLDQLREDMNLDANVAAVPNVAKLPDKLTPEARANITVKAKDALANKAQPSLAVALTDVADKSVAAMTESGALAKVLEKNKGKKVRV